MKLNLEVPNVICPECGMMLVKVISAKERIVLCHMGGAYIKKDECPLNNKMFWVVPPTIEATEL